MKFCKRPVVIDAIQFLYNEKSIKSLEIFMGSALGGCGKDRHPDAVGWLKVNTLEDGFKGSPTATHIATEGDWIIRGVQGEFYPCKPDIFVLTYEENHEKI